MLPLIFSGAISDSAGGTTHTARAPPMPEMILPSSIVHRPTEPAWTSPPTTETSAHRTSDFLIENRGRIEGASRTPTRPPKVKAAAGRYGGAREGQPSLKEAR